MTAQTLRVVVLCGGPSAEREVSLISGRAVAEALNSALRVDKIELSDENLPEGLEPADTIVFPALHGAFGEDGELQALLEKNGFTYVGSDAQASSLCMDKAATKARLRGSSGFQITADCAFAATEKPSVATLLSAVGHDLVFKPLNSGSSVGLGFAAGPAAIGEALDAIACGEWLVEPRIVGREMTIGILEGAALGIVEILPSAGVYDFRHKYTAGMTRYQVPAAIDSQLTQSIAGWAESAYRRCGCRDFARIDFILDVENRAHFLEINTLPGLTPTSLFPKSASHMGYDFKSLVRAMVEPAICRWHLDSN